MNSALKTPIRMLPLAAAAADGAREVEIEVRQMTWEHVNAWHTLVQPLINSRYQHWRPGVNEADARADVGWDWAFNYSLALLHNASTYIPGNKSSRAKALAVVVKSHRGVEAPVGMLTAVPRFRCDVEGQSRDRAFAWYLSDAPKAYYTEVLDVPPIKGVATALLDCTIQCGLDADLDGETLLHADPNGGEKLMEFYTRCAMKQVELTNGPISMLRRKDVDQYFYMNAETARNFCARFDNRRGDRV